MVDLLFEPFCRKDPTEEVMLEADEDDCCCWGWGCEFSLELTLTFLN
jgi:hypothetical protein